MNLLDPLTLAFASRALDAATLRQAVHANNIANASVEGFRPQTVSFEDQMSRQLAALRDGQGLRAEDVLSVQPHVMTREEGATVQLDSELAQMSSNALQYQAVLHALDLQIGLLSMAVSDGRR